MGLFSLHQFDQLDAICARQRDVEKSDVRLEVPHRVQSRSRGRGFPAHSQIGFGIDQRSNAIAENRVIINDENASFLARVAVSLASPFIGIHAA